MANIRPLGKILLDIGTPFLDEMVDDHQIQMGDILALVHVHLKVHRPDCVEVYEDDETTPTFKYE
jgi:UDP-N-acetylglucosamine transferase subunit ALG13